MGDRAWRNAFAADWHATFDPHVALPDIVPRGTVIGLSLFAPMPALTIVLWSWLLERLPVRFPATERRLAASHRPCATARSTARAPRRELMTVDELLTRLRLEAVHDLRTVRRARVESEGRLSVRKRGA